MKPWAFSGLTAVLALSVGALSAYRMDAALLVAAALAVVLVMLVAGADAMACILVVLAGLFVRPSLAGDSSDLVGLGLLAGAALVALLRDRRREPAGRGLRSLVVWLTIAYAWLIVHGLVFRQTASARALVLGLVLSTVGLLAAYIVLREPSRARLAGRLTVFLLAAVSAPYLLTALSWWLIGPGAGQLGTVPLGAAGSEGRVFAPFTVTLGEVQVVGQSLPRLAGVAREPGVMGLYLAVGYFLTRLVGLGRKWRLLLLAGLVATWSTGALAVFLPVWAYDRFWKRARPVVRVVSIPALAAVAWAVLNAPVLGLRDKLADDPYSVADRQVATEAGWEALLSSPLAGADVLVTSVPAVNLIASVAAFGVPFALACTLALWAPARVRPAGATVALAVFLTLLTTQPARDSVWIFVLAMIGYAAAPVITRGRKSGDHEPLGSVADVGRGLPLRERVGRGTVDRL